MDSPTTEGYRSKGKKRAIAVHRVYSQGTGIPNPVLPPRQAPVHTTLLLPSPLTRRVMVSRPAAPARIVESERENSDPLHSMPTWMQVSVLVVLILLVVAIFGGTGPQAVRKVRVASGLSNARGRTGKIGVGGNIPTDGHAKPPVLAVAASLIDATTGATLYASNATVHLPILSTTKLMTALIAVEHGSLAQKITITPEIQRDLNTQLSPDSSLMGVREGETYTLRELMSGLLLVSGNDAAIVIADAVSGSVPAFVALMNLRAEELGMSDTHFMNPHGLMQQGHYSCSRDMGVLGRISLGNPIIRQISATRELRLAETSEHHAYDLINGNQFLWWYPGVDGGKPGWDGGKNFNQVISSTRNGRHLIGVVLGTKDWWTDMRDLLNWGFQLYQWVSPAEVIKSHFIPYAADWNNFTGDRKENTLASTNGGRYYIYTGYSLSGLILAYFDIHGGLSNFGFPISGQVATSSTISQRLVQATIQCNTVTQHCHV